METLGRCCRHFTYSIVVVDVDVTSVATLIDAINAIVVHTPLIDVVVTETDQPCEGSVKFFVAELS